jgi:transcriptional regulator with XRE-family HTH domain
VSTEPGADALSLALGRAIRAARDQAGMSMRALALRCGVSQPFLSEVERGRSTPSIATLYRIAEALDLSPASLLPEHTADPVAVVRAHEGRRVPSSDRPNSAIGRVVFSDDDRHLEVYEYVTTAAEDLDVWFQHPGEKVLHVIEGHLAVELDGRATEHLGPGDCIVHPGTIAHRWQVTGDQPVRIFLVVVRPPA